MLGIDAPESRQMCTSDKGTPYACGLEAKTFMQDLIKNDPVTCFVCFLCCYSKPKCKAAKIFYILLWQAARKDQYGRVLGVCFDEKTGVELNEKMVKEGEAIAYVAYSKVLPSTPPRSQACPRKDFNVLRFESLSSHEEVKGIPTAPFQRLSTKRHIHPLLLQILSQDNVHLPPLKKVFVPL